MNEKQIEQMIDTIKRLEKRIDYLENWIKDFTLLNGGKVIPINKEKEK